MDNLTIDSIELISIAELARFLSKSPAGRITSCKLGELSAARATTHRYEGFDMGVLSLQLGKCCKATILAINLLLQVAEFVEKLGVSALGLHGDSVWVACSKSAIFIDPEYCQLPNRYRDDPKSLT